MKHVWTKLILIHSNRHPATPTDDEGINAKKSPNAVWVSLLG